MSEGKRGYALRLAAVAACGGFLFGFDSGVINGTVNALESAFGASAIGTGMSVASMLLGCALGAFFAGTLADRFGRKPVMLATALVFGASALGSGLSSSALVFIGFRVFGGFGVGAASVIAPTYIAEISPPAIRGRLGSLQQAAIVLGLFTAFLSNYALAALSGGASAPFWLNLPTWRWMYWVELLPAAVFFLGALSVPESPRFLVGRGREAEAQAIFTRLDPERAAGLVAEVRATLSQSGRATLGDLRIPGRLALHPVVWVGIVLGSLQQLVGINVIFYYGAVLWQAAGFSESASLATNLLSGGVNIAGTIVAIVLIDRVGRKPLLLVGSAMMVAALGTVSGIFWNAEMAGTGVALTSSQATAALVAIHLYIIAFAATWGPVVWVLLGEIFPNRIRGVAMAVATLCHWLANFAVTLTFPLLLAGVGLAAAYAGYAAFALLAFFFVKVFLKETKLQSLEAASTGVSAPGAAHADAAPSRTLAESKPQHAS